MARHGKSRGGGKVRTSDFHFESERLEEVLSASEIKPAVLQVECHPYYQQTALKKRVAAYNTAISAGIPSYGDRG